MQSIHKILAICLLLTALAYGVLKILGGVGLSAGGKDDAKTKSRDMVTRHERGEGGSDSSARKPRQRARKLTSTEAREFLKTTVIPEINFENITLKDALKVVNEEIAKQTLEGQPRVRILIDPNYHYQFERNWKMSIDHIGSNFIGATVVDIRERQIPVDILLKHISDQTHTRFWFYKGDYYLSWINDGGIPYSFYHSEKLSRLKLENVDASQLALRLNEVIDHHEYFGPKTIIDITMTKKAHDALLKGEVKLPRINLNLENVTLSQSLMKIEEQTGGALVVSEQNLLFNPFNEVNNTDPFAPAGEGGSFDISLNEDTINPNFVPVKDPFK